MKIVGYSSYAFTPKGEKHEITGITFYTEDPIPPNRGVGVQTGKLSLSDNQISKLGLNVQNLIGKEVSVAYNQFGKPQDIQILK